ncbi:hypothetical protein ACMGD3_13245 [Lysinibacillus sphaericus]|uniref:hypothetical protein n=1 Tax=Lysinibacillus sphaericus TaxID=1421 RepID=UPI003F799EB8
MTVELGIVLTILSLVVAVQGYQLNKTKSIKDDGKQTAEVSAQLQYISKGVNDIQIDMKDIRLDMKASEQKVQGQIQDVVERVTRNEESAKQAHKRIDKLEEK